uniref:Dynactin subunit 6 n=1 Tax=Oryctolagus cuniculus TaxID=9986 RepID=A0A5F9DIP2_RABIT
MSWVGINSYLTSNLSTSWDRANIAARHRRHAQSCVPKHRAKRRKWVSSPPSRPRPQPRPSRPRPQGPSSASGPAPPRPRPIPGPRPPAPPTQGLPRRPGPGAPPRSQACQALQSRLEIIDLPRRRCRPRLQAESRAVPWRRRLKRGPRTVIHPKARIIAEAGPIVIGEGNLIEEQALIINAYPDNITPDVEDPEPKPMVIGTNNVFEVGCYSQAMKMGDNNVIESKAYVGRNVILTSGCIIGACCNLNTFEVIPENTVIYGADCLRRVQTERPQPQTLQLDFLMKILPNYHHLKKTMKGSSTPVKN